MPTAMFLDTSALAGQQYNFSSTALTTLLPAAQKAGVALLVPAPTEGEVKRHIRERSDQALKALDQARRKAPFLSKWEHFPKFKGVSSPNWHVYRIALREWDEFLSQFDVKRLGYEGVDLNRIMSWYEANTPPFGTGKKRKEFPDAFAAAALEAMPGSTMPTLPSSRPIRTLRPCARAIPICSTSPQSRA